MMKTFFKVGPFSAYRQDIYWEGSKYMERWIMKLPFGRMLRLHHICRADTARDPHDHPFDFFSLVLRGGYHEHLTEPDRYCYRRAGSVCYRPHHTLHTIAGVDENTWTLVWAIERQPSWGFKVNPYTHIDWKHYIGLECK